jgi:FkbM family methyltransferase
LISYFKRIHKIASYWAPIIGSYPDAFYFFARAKFGMVTTNAVYGGNPFRFRSCDLSAIDETLIRGEYQFIVPIIESIDAPLILDVGMNIGDFSILAVALNPSSLIVGIEADGATATLAQSNHPPGHKGLWTVHHRAAWQNNDQIYLEAAAASVSNRVSEVGHVPVRGIDLATLWSLLPREEVDIMKIDIEGAEEVFLFSQPEFLDKVRHLIIEIHPLACDEARVRSLLSQHFPSVKDVAGRISSKPLLYCKRL